MAPPRFFWKVSSVKKDVAHFCRVLRVDCCKMKDPKENSHHTKISFSFLPKKNFSQGKLKKSKKFCKRFGKNFQSIKLDLVRELTGDPWLMAPCPRWGLWISNIWKFIKRLKRAKILLVILKEFCKVHRKIAENLKTRSKR